LLPPPTSGNGISGGNVFVRNVGTSVPNCTVTRPRRYYWSCGFAFSRVRASSSCSPSIDTQEVLYLTECRLSCSCVQCQRIAAKLLMTAYTLYFLYLLKCAGSLRWATATSSRICRRSCIAYHNLTSDKVF
jgi:hypothetical protein